MQSTDLSTNQGSTAAGNVYPSHFTEDKLVYCSLQLVRNQKANGVPPIVAYRSTAFKHTASDPDPS